MHFCIVKNHRYIKRGVAKTGEKREGVINKSGGRARSNGRSGYRTWRKSEPQSARASSKPSSAGMFSPTAQIHRGCLSYFLFLVCYFISPGEAIVSHWGKAGWELGVDRLSGGTRSCRQAAVCSALWRFWWFPGLVRNEPTEGAFLPSNPKQIEVSVCVYVCACNGDGIWVCKIMFHCFPSTTQKNEDASHIFPLHPSVCRVGLPIFYAWSFSRRSAGRALPLTISLMTERAMHKYHQRTRVRGCTVFKHLHEQHSRLRWWGCAVMPLC